MADHSPFLNDLAGRLSGEGFSITRNLGFSVNDGSAPGRYNVDIMAARGEQSALRGNWARYVVVTTMDSPTPEAVTAFSKFAFVYSLTNSRTFLPNFTRARAIRVVVPVIVSQTLTDEMKKWISGDNPAKDAKFTLPVLMESASRQAYFSRNLPFVEAMTWRSVRKFVEETLNPSNA